MREQSLRILFVLSFAAHVALSFGDTSVPAAALADIESRSGKCTSKDTESCLETKCCNDKSLTCYKKDKYWAGCKSSCTPGIDPNDPPEYQTEWSCEVLSSSPSSRRRKGGSPRRRTDIRRRSPKRRRSSRRRSSRRRGPRPSRRRTIRRRRKSSPPTPAPPTPRPTRRRGEPPSTRRRSPAPTPGGGDGERSGKKIKGHLTMWANNDALIGAQCEYANAPINSIKDPILPGYLRTGFHCAIGDSNPGFGKGENCGKCYELISLSDKGTGGTPGKIGPPTKIMVSNGGAGGPAHFDCIMESFEKITGARTGIFDITFEEVTCDDSEMSDSTKGIVVTNWADKNAYYCKMMFGNVGGWGSLESVEMCLNGSKCKKLQLFAGATWTGCPGGEGSSTLWKFTQKSAKDGSKKTVSCNCSQKWPWNTGQKCLCSENF